MKSFLAFAAVSLLGFSLAHAEEVQVFKTMDGNTAYCDSTTRSTESANQKIAMLEMAQYKISETQADATLRVSLVKCDNGTWITDALPNSENYTASNGEQVTLNFSKFELFVVDKNYNIILQTSLDHLNGTPLATIADTVKVTLPRNQRGPSAAYEVFIRVNKTVTSSGGYTYTETVNFGGFRIRLLN